MITSKSSKASDEEEATEKNTLESEQVTFDDVLERVGEFGRFQIILYILFSLPYLETAMQLMGWVFVGAIPEHSCQNQTITLTSNVSSVTSDWQLGKMFYFAKRKVLSICLHLAFS